MKKPDFTNNQPSFIGKRIISFERGLLNLFGVQFLSVEDINSLSVQLAEKIRQDSSFNPDFVIGILNGGYLPAKRIAENLHLPYDLIDISRRKKYISGLDINDRVLLPKILGIYGKSNPIINQPFHNIGNFERILLVDDDCGRGVTLDFAEKEIRKHSNVKEIKKATLFIYPERYCPDYFVEEMEPINSVITCKKRFPWRSYSPYFSQYKQVVEQSS